MAQEGLILRVTHTGLAADSIHVSDIQDGVDVLASFRKAGPVYIPTPAKGGVADLVYSGDVAISHASGGICKFIEGGYLTAEFVAGDGFAALLPSVLDEGTLLTTKPTSLNFVGAGVVATVVGDDVTITIAGGGAATDHSTLSNLPWASAGHTGPLGSLPSFDGAGAATTLAGTVQGDTIYFDGTIWTRLPPGTSGQVLSTQGAGANPQWVAGAATDELVAVSANDTTPGYLLGKLTTATTGVAWTEVNDGGDEDLRLDIDSATEGGPGLIELATQAEVDAGTDTTRAITSATLAASTPTNIPLTLEMELAFKTAFLYNYKELFYTGKNLTRVEIWETPAKLSQLFGKTLAYTGKKLTTSVLTRISDAATLTQTFGYTGKNLTSVTRT